ncbi:hypothetical protein GHT09_015272 [Marmota monax]|uniref:Uncharacterized protein n=1 Tax=Marmota monax TaxID=9995 RepID=A0A834UXR1_MARMO|nr:hypothetical protein GHT09_015272 [Marmota monax]
MLLSPCQRRGHLVLGVRVLEDPYLKGFPWPSGGSWLGSRCQPGSVEVRWKVELLLLGGRLVRTSLVTLGFGWFCPELTGRFLPGTKSNLLCLSVCLHTLAVVIGKAPLSMTSGSRSPPEMPVLTRSSSQTPVAGIPANTSTMSTVTGSLVKKQRPLLPKETALAVHPVVWNSSSKFQTSFQKWHMQKMQHQQQQHSQQQQPQSSQGTRYQTRQAVKAVQQKEVTQSPSMSTITLVTSTQPSPLISSSGCTSTLTSSVSADLPIATASADVAADIAKYVSKMMDAIKGMMTEIYNNLSKNTTGSTIAEIRRLRIEIKKLQWLHQQELSEMKHNLELTMAEMQQSLEWEWDKLIAKVKKQLELEKQQAVDETKKKQWCAHCKKEVIFYCCWNTSYCDYPCQQAH